MKDVVIVSGARTPIGMYGGSLRDVPLYKFTSLVLNEAVKRAKVEPAWVDDVIMGVSLTKMVSVPMVPAWPSLKPDGLMKFQV